MLCDLRSYRCRPGTMAGQLKLYEGRGYAAQCAHPGYQTEQTNTLLKPAAFWLP